MNLINRLMQITVKSRALGRRGSQAFTLSTFQSIEHFLKIDEKIVLKANNS
jgi:hypothetical protein